ncbi:endonuclease/exonuclease/phosphatase family protein [Bacteriovorax sp. BAL6_X]|uniref:endonuclease/exonuclease/phosphatase family protein n=1 Tax=Bacteriovorax sp. BAL6_X TaxID=1201290 RepID=UPI0003862FAB|nr:endonuclease/exonuclease/phosphatase family protein [Bacteriovorax sp. BAL6_X]EPZ52447.1 endonuclease/exonuclease/phosphatase family protein [Bacteriovorax sp. BAL6_X]
MRKLGLLITSLLLLQGSVLAANNMANLIYKIPSKDKILSTKGSVNCTECKLGTRFNVTVWNMYKGKEPSWASDYLKLASESEVILGQEFLLQGEMREVLSNSQRESVLATSFYNTDGQATGVFTSSIVKAIGKQAIQSSDREPIVNTPKLAVITQYPADNGQIVTFVNIHALNFVGIQPFTIQIVTLLKTVENIKGPVVFAGDFNTNAPTKTLLMNILLKKEGFMQVHYTGTDDRMTFLGQPLDHIWYRGLNLVEARVLGEVEGSDHTPLQAEFELID